MEHRREPMGGEVGSSEQRIGPDWANNNPAVDASNQSTDSAYNEQFVDSLTLRVRSLLSNWDDYEPQDYVPQRNAVSPHSENLANISSSADYRQFSFGRNRSAASFDDSASVDNRREEIEGEISASGRSTIAQKASMATQASTGSSQQFDLGCSRIVGPFLGNLSPNSSREEVEGEISGENQASRTSKISKRSQANVSVTVDTRQTLFDPNLMARTSSIGSPRNDVEGEFLAGSRVNSSRKSSKLSKGNQAMVSATIDTKQFLFDSNLKARTSSVGSSREEVEGEMSVENQPSRPSNVTDSRQSLFDLNFNARTSSSGSPREEIEGRISAGKQISIFGKTSKAFKGNQAKVSTTFNSRQSLFDSSLLAGTSSGVCRREEVEGETSAAESAKTAKSSSFVFGKKCQTKHGSIPQQSSRFQRSDNFQSFSNFSSQTQHNQQVPLISISDRDQPDLISEESQISGLNSAGVPSLSYVDFSQELQNRFNQSRKQDPKLAKRSVSNRPSLKKSCMFDSDSEQSPESHTDPDQAGHSQHLGLPHESLENEAERSWSEITVRAESFMQLNDSLSKRKLHPQGSTNVFRGQNVRTSTMSSATKMSKFIGVDPRTSTRVPSNLNYPSVKDSDTTLGTSTIAADTKTSRSVSVNSKRTTGEPVNQIADSVMTSNPRIVVGCNVATDNTILNTVPSNINIPAMDLRFKESAASSSSSPVDFNSKPKGSSDRQRNSPFNPSTNNKMTFQDSLASESRQLLGESAGDNSSLNVTDFNMSQFDRAFSNRNIRQIDLLSHNPAHIEDVSSSRDARRGDFADRRGNLVVAFRSGVLEGDGESSNLIQLDESPTGISQEPSPASIPASRVGSRASMDDWRINLFGRDPPRDPYDLEVPPRDPYDLDDPSERETPPLSASSMASSSRRLEWDNGADIGYSIAILRPTRVIPDVARSDPEGISLMNDTLNMGGASPFPYFSFRSVSSSNFAMDQGNETMADASSQISNDNQSSGSQSLSDSRKSVIYNSVRDMRRVSKSLSSTNGSPRLQRRSFRNLSCPDLTDLRRDWLASNDFLVSKSEEQVGKALKTYIFPGLVAQRLSGHRNAPFGVGRSSSSEVEDGQNKGDNLVESAQDTYQNAVGASHDPLLEPTQSQNVYNTRALPINQLPMQYYHRGDVPTERSQTHVCKNCQGPLNTAGEQIASQNVAEEDQFHTEIEEAEYYPSYEDDPMSPAIEWTHPETYVDEFARPVLVVSNNASKLEGRTDLSKIVGRFFDSHANDNSGGNSEVKPHIRWYPFTPNQDIKDVSTQTSVSFVAQQQSKDAVANRAVFAQQTSNPEDIIVEMQPDVFHLPETQGSRNVSDFQRDSNKFSQIGGIPGKKDSDSPEVSASETQNVASFSQQSPSIRPSRTPSLSSLFLMPDNGLPSNISNERNIPGETNSNVQDIFGASTSAAKSLIRNTSLHAYSHRSSSISNLESEFLSPENLQVSISQESDSETTRTGQTLASCHTNVNTSDDRKSRVASSSKDRLQQTLATNSQNPFNTDYSSNTENNSTTDMEQLISLFSGRPSTSVSSSGVALMNPREERKLGVGECQKMPSHRQNNSMTASSPFIQEGLTANLENVPLLKSSNVRNQVVAVDHAGSAFQQGSQGNLTDENFQQNFVRTSINTLKTFQDLVTTGSRISIPGGNAKTIPASNVNTTQDLPHLENNLSSNVNLQRGSIRESRNVSSSKTTYSTDIKNNLSSHINRQRAEVKEIQDATGNRTRNTSNFNNNLSSNAGRMIQSRFPASATNLLDFLSSNRPFSDSKYLEQKEGIPKSFSDPLIAGPQSDSSSEEDSGLVTFRSHAYEESSAEPNPQSVGYRPRQVLQKERCFGSRGSNSPEVVFQESTNRALQKQSVALTNQNVLTTKMQDPRESWNSQQSFVASQQVNQSTSVKDVSVDASRKESESQSRSSSFLLGRELSLGRLGSEDFMSNQISSRKRGNFSDAATSPINLGISSLHFPQASTKKMEDVNGTNAWGTREHILRKSSADSQIQTDSDKHPERSPYIHSSTPHEDSSGIRPEFRLREHSIRHQEYGIGHQEHEMRHQGLENKQQEHPSKHQDPDMRQQEHQIRHNQHQIKHQEFKMRDQGHEVKQQEHENRHQEHQIRHKQSDNRHQEPEIRHQQSYSGNQESNIGYTTRQPKNGERIVDIGSRAPEPNATYSQTQSELDDILLQLRENLRILSNGVPMPGTSRYAMDPRTIDSKSQHDSPMQTVGRSRLGSSSHSVKEDSLKPTTFRPRSGSNSFQQRDLYSAKRGPLAPSNQNFASVGVQVPSEYSHGTNLESEQCSFCHQSKVSHPIRCPRREAFKVVLGRALEKGTSYCVYSNMCKCCCDKTLQEAFNLHRADIIKRIEARQKEVETKTTKSFFLNLARPVTSQQKSNKTKLKPAYDKPSSSNRFQSNKENIQRKNSRNYSTSYPNSSKQRSHQKQLNKYNRVMSKIYSQRLKSEILRGKVNFSRHEILMNS